jgi:SAM-dependent methyltransferase
LLDVGCGPGFLLEAARRRGWEVLGVDPSRFAADSAAHTFGVRVLCCSLAEAALEPVSFDAVSLLHAVEHFADPVAALADVARLLRPGGVLFLETPNAASEGYRLFGREWVLLNPMEHRYVFSPRTLARALEAAGLQVLTISAPLRDPPPDRDLLYAWAQVPKRVPLTRAEVVLRVGRALGLRAAGAGPYTDAPRGEGEAELRALAEAGALPWPAPRMEPDRLVTRAEVGLMLAVVLGIALPAGRAQEGPAPAPPFFTDVPGPEGAAKGHPAWRHLHLLRQAHFGGGFEQAAFRPDEPITEAELETLLRCAVRWRGAHQTPPDPR